MKKKFFLILAAVLLAGTSAMAQKVVLNYANGKTLKVRVSSLESISFEEANPDEYEWVDLGLPSGTMWATCNVGADSPEDYGSYFAWGEKAEKGSYSWDNYQWMTEGQAGWQYISKYTIADGQTEGCWYSGSTFIGDNKAELMTTDDAAYALWGRVWQIPSKEQFDELMNKDNTTTVWTTLNGVEGRKITSKSNGNSIFLPAAGNFGTSGIDKEGSSGSYWSRELSASYTDLGSNLYFTSAISRISTTARCTGLSIRPVRLEHEYVDLDLPSGTLWATCNVGANSPEEYGDYFAWGETEPKEYYYWDNYKWSKDYSPGHDNLTKYNQQPEYGYDGFTDELTELLPEDDAATVKWGSQWQMPSKEQIRELLKGTNTTAEFTTENGVNGYKITSKSNGKSIFLPAAGMIDNFGDLVNVGRDGTYWSRTFDVDSSDGVALSYYSINDKYYIQAGIAARFLGNSVRPVRKK